MVQYCECYLDPESVLTSRRWPHSDILRPVLIAVMHVPKELRLDVAE
jgi:hypothetical protein